MVCPKAPVFQTNSSSLVTVLTDTWQKIELLDHHNNIWIPLSPFPSHSQCMHVMDVHDTFYRCPWQFRYSSTSDQLCPSPSLEMKTVIRVKLFINEWHCFPKLLIITYHWSYMYIGVSHTLESVIQSLESFIHLLCDVLCFVYACLTQALEWELLALKHAVAMCRDLYHNYTHPQTWSCSPINVVSQLFTLH